MLPSMTYKSYTTIGRTESLAYLYSKSFYLKSPSKKEVNEALENRELIYSILRSEAYGIFQGDSPCMS